MKNKISSIYNSLGLLSIIPIFVYIVLLAPSTIIFFFTWLLSPLQTESFRELENLELI